ncbi:hypothetical protein QR680_005511 [Steinernema hermaphroditum]|uniref:Uncharacterized protein n=1 Tax=Steinernema hermaphroditum TaxID=289476 RepID=A0AA39HUH3_9BILA|nr:hypothetical protein QR680_005511 [Steinernema hermaphroditum]
MNSLNYGASFPFDFLHAEIVKYQQEKEQKEKEVRQQYSEKVNSGLDAEVLADSQLIQQLFEQGNAETRLESMGFRVGFALVEKIAKDVPRFSTELDVMKFICKEFWTSAFGKQVDNLRTNHQGVYVVQDNRFYTVSSFSESKQYLEEAAIYLSFPSGVIRGALQNLGVNSNTTMKLLGFTLYVLVSSVLASLDTNAVIVAFSSQVTFGLPACQELTDPNGTVVQSIGRRSLVLVEVDPSQTFRVAACEDRRRPRCGTRPNSFCATQYEWRFARVRSVPRSSFLEDKILVPSGCTCVISEQLGSFSSPVFEN